MNHLIKKIERDALWSKVAGELTTTTIIIPVPFYLESIELTKKQNEVAGWLVCYKNTAGGFTTYIVECIYVAKEGSMGYVSNTNRLSFSDVENYCIIEFHTHPEALGKYWWDKFSDFKDDGTTGDMKAFAERIRYDNQYKHILFTPTHILTFGNEKPDVRVANLKEENESAIRKKKTSPQSERTEIIGLKLSIKNFKTHERTLCNQNQNQQWA